MRSNAPAYRPEEFLNFQKRCHFLPPTDLYLHPRSPSSDLSHRPIDRAGGPVRCVPPFLFHSEREPNVPFSQQPQKWERTYLESKRVKVALAAAESGIFSGVKVQRMILHRYRHKRQEKRKKVSRRTVHMALFFDYHVIHT